MSKTTVAVYGTLLSGLHNHQLFEIHPEEVKFLGRGLADFYAIMYSAGGFPILSFIEPEYRPVVELYEVGEQTLKLLDQLEGYPGWYDRQERNFICHTGEKVRAFIYFQNDTRDLEIVPEGNWRKFKAGGNY
ncbi:gamma-glutamyl cyclotransferase [Pseudomonas phage NV1]|uniref:Gamma-glutamylcyclotransferase AIG2-like domain-containing protein n=1 Tax=Pseudomonas phage NV1 TaxID=2079543 RepID=A0A2L0HPQ2_9CAUD|nr:gamma-glutamyl cyclotransferase [Pseudomonas phage NV1]AUX83651.1 hypothetical protein NV1_p22 [Pseudomonas phage NV1]